MVRPATGNQGERRWTLADRLDLLLANLRRNKAQDPDAPRLAGRQVASFLEQLLGLGLARQGQGEKRQTAGTGDRLGKGGRVADARHRTLDNGIARLVPDRQRGAGGQRAQPPGGLELLPTPAAHRLNDAGHGHKPLGEWLGKARILPQRPQGAVGLPRADRFSPRRAFFLSRCHRLTEAFFVPAQLFDGRHAGAEIESIGFAQTFPQTGGLAAVEGGQALASDLVKRTFACEKELGIEHHAGGAAGQARGGGIEPDPALHPHRQCCVIRVSSIGEPALHEDECRLRADAAPRLLAFENQTVGPERLGPLSFGKADRFEEHSDVPFAKEPDPPLQVWTPPSRQEDPGQPGRRIGHEMFHQRTVVAADLDAEAPVDVPMQSSHGRQGDVRTCGIFQVHKPTGAGTAGRHCQRGMTEPRRGQRDHVLGIHEIPSSIRPWKCRCPRHWGETRRPR